MWDTREGAQGGCCLLLEQLLTLSVLLMGEQLLLHSTGHSMLLHPQSYRLCSASLADTC